MKTSWLFGGSLGITACMLVAFSSLAQDRPAPEIITTDLGHGIYAIVARGGNMGVSLGEDGIYVIDDQYAPLSELLLAEIAQLSDGPISYVLNTHWHGDHTGGNEAFAATGAVLVSHDNVRARMAEGLDGDWFGRIIEPLSGDVLPAITISENATFHFNGQEVHLIHTPNAHTDGDVIVHFVGANVLHMGDTFFSGFYPYADIASGGSIDGMIAALALGLSLSDDETEIIPGHGPLASRSDLLAAHDMLVEVRSRVQGAIHAGMDEDEAVVAGLLQDLNEEWEWGFITPERMVRLTYQSLTQ